MHTCYLTCCEKYRHYDVLEEKYLALVWKAAFCLNVGIVKVMLREV